MPILGKESISKKHYHNFGFLILTIYFIFCGVYSLERVCYADTAHMLFKIIQSGRFNIEAGRYPQILTQIPTILALKFLPSLKAIVFIYSVSFPLLFAACAAIAYKVYNNKWAPALLVFALIGSVNYGFFHSATETHQSIAWGLLFYSWMMQSAITFKTKKEYYKHLLAGAFFAVLCMHAHPVGFFFIVFSVGYYVTERKDLKNPSTYIILMLIAALSIIKTSQTEATSYEGQFLSLIPAFPSLLGDFSNNWSWAYFIEESDKTYFLICLVFLIGNLWMLICGKYLRAAFYTTFNLGLLLFTLLIYHKGDSYVMMERAFMPLAFTTAAPLFDMICRSKRTQNNILQLVVMAFIFFQGFKGIQKKGLFMTERLNYIESLHQRFEAQKVCLKTSQVDMNLIQVPWPVCFESLIYSGARFGKDNCYTIAVLHEEEYANANTTDPDNFIVPGFFGGLKTSALNTGYFNIKQLPYLTVSNQEMEPNSP
jgi:hypothetical protein